MDQHTIPIETRHLFAPLDEKLIDLLKSISPEDWQKPTVAKQWNVKDVASHLLDGNLRTLSMQKEGYFGEKAPEFKSYRELVDWLNQLNADWVKATKRLSPNVLILLLETTGKLVSDYYASLPPWEEAIFSVAWAGENTSYNWMHVAREYTEKWHHQQQIREAVGQPGILTPTYFYPVLDAFFQALPHTFKNVEAEDKTLISIVVSSEAGGVWQLSNANQKWHLSSGVVENPAATVELPANLAWKLFSKSIRPSEIRKKVIITGDQQLGAKVLEMVSVMA